MPVAAGPRSSAYNRLLPKPFWDAGTILASFQLQRCAQGRGQPTQQERIENNNA